MNKSPYIFNYTVSNQTENSVFEVFIDGEILDAETQQMYEYWYGDNTSVSYRSFRNAIDSANPKTINIFVNSPGGNPLEAFAIHDYLQALQQKGTVVNVTGRGFVASAATYFQLAVPKANRFITRNSFMLIHNIQGGVWGDLRVMQNYVATCERFNKAIADLYTQNSNMSNEDCVAMMDAETVLGATEMVEHGFLLEENILGETTFKNLINVRDWPFKNKAILNTYNSFTNSNFNNMFENIAEKIKNAVAEAMKPFTNKAPKEGEPTIDNEALATAVANAVSLVYNKADFDAAVAAEVKNAIDSNKDTISNLVATAVADGIKELANAKDLTDLQNEVNTLKQANETLKSDLANKLGGAAAGEKAKNATESKWSNAATYGSEA